jgi:Kef-type K+ transport system membrane component KefB
VNAILLLMGLLVLSYLGSFLVARRSVGGAGLPSGIEYTALGFVLGPHALGLVGPDDLRAFEPVVQVALGWLAFGIGLDFGFAGPRRVRAGRMAFSSFGAIVTGTSVAAATWLALRLLRVDLTPDNRFLLAGGIGAACSETTRHAVSWILDRYGARGELAETLNDIAHADDMFPLIAVAVLFALDRVPTAAVVTVALPLRDLPALTASIGFVLGAGAALLLRSEMRIEDTWSVLFGVSLLVIGTAARLGLSAITASFFMGLAVSTLSHHGRQLRAMVGPTERPVLLPALVLAGAHLDFRSSSALPWIAAAAIGARVLAKVVLGWMLAVRSPAARKAGPLLGLSLMSSGSLAMCIGLAFALRMPGPVGDTVLVVAAISATVGEFVGPTWLRRTLQVAGEIEETTTAVDPARTGA